MLQIYLHFGSWFNRSAELQRYVSKLKRTKVMEKSIPQIICWCSHQMLFLKQNLIWKCKLGRAISYSQINTRLIFSFLRFCLFYWISWMEILSNLIFFFTFSFSKYLNTFLYSEGSAKWKWVAVCFLTIPKGNIDCWMW